MSILVSGHVLRASLCALVGIAATLVPMTAIADDIVVILDRAKIEKLPERTTTVVIGNPLIADVVVQAGGVMVITGKGYGDTNMIALDRAGKTLIEHQISVRSPLDSVVVYRGDVRESYSCQPTCERRITLGDTPEFFDATLAQTGNRNGRGAQNPNGGGPQR